MTSKSPLKKNSKKNFKSYFKIVFLTKKFKERNQHYIPKTFSKCNDQEHQNTQCYDITEISKSMEPNKCIH
jgi:hypothetical protein